MIGPVGTWSGVSAGEVVGEVTEVSEVVGEVAEVVGEVIGVVGEVVGVVAEVFGVVGEVVGVVAEVSDAGMVTSRTFSKGSKWMNVSQSRHLCHQMDILT